MSPLPITSHAEYAARFRGLRATLAIAGQSVRTAGRSRLLAVLILFLGLVLFGLPLSIKGDGTLPGKLRVLLEYNLGLTALLLAAATLWTACGAVSQEIRDRHILLVAVKPVHRWQVWLGKWLGIVAINAVLLSGAGIVTYLLVLHSVNAPGVSDAERKQVQAGVLQGRRLVVPRFEPVQAVAQKRLRELTTRGLVPATVSPQEALSMLQGEVIAERSVVAPAAGKKWRLDPPPGGWPISGDSRRIVLRMRYRASSMEDMPVGGTWTISGANPAHRAVIRTPPGKGGVRQLDVPTAAIAGNAPALIRFENDAPGLSCTAVFDHEEPVALLIEESGFLPNLLRALIVIGGFMALLAALGLTAGAVLSFPVAAFVSAVLLGLALLGHSFSAAATPGVGPEHGHSHAPEGPTTLLDRAGNAVSGGIEAVAAPVLQFDPLSRLADGVLVPWTMVAEALGLAVVLYGGALGALGSVYLTRRQLALPGGDRFFCGQSIMNRKLASMLIVILAVAAFWLAGALNGSLNRTRAAAQPGAGGDLSDAPPLLSLTIGALGGFRGLAADLLWLRVSYLQDRGEYFEIVQLADWIARLRPRSAGVWSYHAWNMSYNISAMMPDPDDRWRWVVNGLKLLRDEGLRCNGEDADMYAALANLYMFKIADIHEPGHADFQRRFAEEMTALFGGPTPNYAALAADPERRRRIVEDYKLDPDSMRRLDERHGPLDWRLAQTHAVYWAWKGRAYEKNPASLKCDRFIFQGLAQLFIRGKLLWQPERRAFQSGPNPALLPRVIGVYEEMLARHSDQSVRDSYASFLSQAIVILHGVDREQAMATFDLLQRKFPAPDTARGYEAFVTVYRAKLKGSP